MTLLALILGLVVLLALMSGGVLRRPVERLASHELGREVRMEALRLNLLSFSPSVQVEGLRVANAGWAGTERMADVGKLDVAVRLWPLLRGDIVLPRVELENATVRLARQANGHGNWQAEGAPAPRGGPIKWPVVENLAVGNSHIEFTDAGKNIKFSGDFSTRTGGSEAKLALDGSGTLNGQPFRLTLNGGAPDTLRQAAAYPFSFEFRHGRTEITAEGTVARAFDFGAFKAAVSLQGQNLADLYYLTGLALPRTRSYSLRGDLAREGDVFRLTGLTGRLGNSDMTGNLTVRTGGARPVLTANLASRLLDPADAGVLFGSAPSTERLLPDTEFSVVRLRSMDAAVRYSAQAIQVASLPLKEVSFTLALEQGQLVLEPLALTLPQGRVTGWLEVDARGDVPAMAVDAKLSGARLEDFMAKTGQPSALAGPLVARVKLAGVGNSVHQVAGNASGTAAVVVPRGQIRAAFAELLGIDVARGLGLLLAGDQQPTTLRCGVASFEAKNGVLDAQNVVLDTGVVVARGGGTVDLRDESLDLTLKGEPKEARLVRLAVPIRVTGVLRKPKLGVDAGQLGVQAGVATALGAVLTPLAAILPFVDAGLAEDADCRALIREAKKVGVGVK